MQRGRLWNADGIAVSVATGVQENPVIGERWKWRCDCWTGMTSGQVNSFRRSLCTACGEQQRAASGIKFVQQQALLQSSGGDSSGPPATETSNYGFEVERMSMNNEQLPHYQLEQSWVC